MPKNQTLAKIFLIELIFVFFIVAFSFNFILTWIDYAHPFQDGNEYSLLADSFLSGRLDLPKYPHTDLDCSLQDGRCFWAPGPLPALLIVPFQFCFELAGAYFYQGYLNFLLLIGVFFLCFKLAGKFKYSFWDSLWLAFLFCFASVYIGIALNQNSWYLAQSVSVFFVLLSLYEFFGKRRYSLIGILMALVFASRLTAGLGIIFFILAAIFSERTSLKAKLKDLSLLLAPCAFAGLALGCYNYVRFGVFLDSGFARASVGSKIESRMSHGLFSLYYFPANFYYYFIKLPVLRGIWWVDPMGVSFFVVSPVFIKIFWTRFKYRLQIFAAAASSIILLILLIYYNTGFWQYGPRYLLDLLPFWFLLLLYNFKDRRLGAWKPVIAISAGLNLFLYISTLLAQYDLID